MVSVDAGGGEDFSEHYEGDIECGGNDEDVGNNDNECEEEDCVGGDDEDYEHCGKYKRVLGIQISIKYQIGTLTKPNTGYF